MTPKPIMEDVARAVGYSRATVSLALRGDASIPEKTRQRIAKVAEKLGYRTNPLVSALMSLQRQRRYAGRTEHAERLRAEASVLTELVR